MKQPVGAPANQTNATALIVVLLLVDSLHFVFARLLLPYLPPNTSVFYVLLVATVETAVFLIIRRQFQFTLLRAHWRFFAVIGFLVAASTSLNYIAVSFIDPGTASLLGQTTTVFALGLGLFWLKERLTRLELVGATVAILGSFVISFQPGDLLRLGSVMVLSGAAMYALHAAVVKRHGGQMDFGNFFFYRVASTTFFLLLFAVGRGQLTAVSDLNVWLLLILVGSVDVVFSRMLYYLVLRRLRMSLHAIVLTLSPVITILWSMLLFTERPSFQGLMGGTAVLLGVLIVTVAQSRRRVAVNQ
jgi:drug/metabolite transporter (DMT)-like permease